MDPKTYLVLPFRRNASWLASELDKEEPPCGRHASGKRQDPCLWWTLDAKGRDDILASELSLDGWYEISFRSFIGFKKIVLHYIPN